jgi:hypothetical protein
MIQKRREDYTKQEKVRAELSKKGYISMASIALRDKDAIRDLGIEPNDIPKPPAVKKLFDSSDDLSCICIDYIGKKSYWYLISDLAKLYPVNTKTEIPI